MCTSDVAKHLIASVGKPVARSWWGELEWRDTQARSHNMQYVLDNIRIIEALLYLLVDASSCFLLLLWEPTPALTQHFTLLLLKCAKLVHSHSRLLQLGLCLLELLHHVPVCDPYVHHLVDPP